MKNNQYGFGLIAVFAVALVLTVVAFTGWAIIAKSQTKEKVRQNTAVKTSVNSEKQSETDTKTNETSKDLSVSEWKVRFSQPSNHTAALSADSGPDYISGAEGGVYVYLPEYDNTYTCGSDVRETHKAKIGTIEKFNLESNIENNDKNAPDVIKTSGNNKYGFYAINQINECYDIATAAIITQVIDQYINNFSVEPLE